MAVRLVRDTNCHQHQVPPDPQPKFGIPLNGERVDAQVRRADYLHVKPDPQRYKSTFNAMRNPDTVRDDLAFRNLRKDVDPVTTDPDQLGIVRDPNLPRTLVSCWKHRHERSLSPTVFYPNRNNVLMRSLAERVTQVVRSQAGRSSGGSESDVITYHDIANDPEILEAVKASLGIMDDSNTGDENDEI